MTGRKSVDNERKVTYGRGGAGNIGPPSPALKPSKGPGNPGDLETPTLKTKNYTTGRGGTGNMAKFDPERPELAREAQDVNAPLAAELQKEGGYHIGRGGTGNTYHPTPDEAEEAQQHNKLIRSRSRGQDEPKNQGTTNADKFKGIADKAKEKILGN